MWCFQMFFSGLQLNRGAHIALVLIFPIKYIKWIFLSSSYSKPAILKHNVYNKSSHSYNPNIIKNLKDFNSICDWSLAKQCFSGLQRKSFVWVTVTVLPDFCCHEMRKDPLNRIVNVRVISVSSYSTFFTTICFSLSVNSSINHIGQRIEILW